MTDAQYAGIYAMLFLIMLITEIGLLSVCNHLKAIKRLLEKRDKDDD